MSTSADDGFFHGQVFANRQRNAQVGQERAVTDSWIARANQVESERNSWKNVAQDLRAKLAGLELELVRAEVQGRAGLDLARELREHIGSIAPNDPLSKVETFRPRMRQRKRELADARGYIVVQDDGFVIARK